MLARIPVSNLLHFDRGVCLPYIGVLVILCVTQRSRLNGETFP